jgi:hypothetical protein
MADKIEIIYTALDELADALRRWVVQSDHPKSAAVAEQYLIFIDKYRRELQAAQDRIESSLSMPTALQIAELADPSVLIDDYQETLQRSHDVLTIMSSDPTLPGEPGSIPDIPPPLPWPSTER